VKLYRDRPLFSAGVVWDDVASHLTDEWQTVEQLACKVPFGVAAVRNGLGWACSKMMIDFRRFNGRTQYRKRQHGAKP